MAGRQPTLQDSVDRGTVVAGEDSEVSWTVENPGELRTEYEPDQTVNGITASVAVGTPQDGTWSVDGTVRVEARGRKLIASLFPHYQRDSVAQERKAARFDSREAAEAAAKRLMSNLTSEAMLEQFIAGIASRWEDIDSRDVDVIRSELESGV